MTIDVETALKMAKAISELPGFDIFDTPMDFYKILDEAGLIEEEGDRITNDMFYDPDAVAFALKCVQLITKTQETEE